MRNKTFVKSAGMGMTNMFKAQVIERRPGHPDEGKVVHETPLTPNLILNQGMDNVASLSVCNLFVYCAVGSGSTPTEDDSGAVLAQTSGTNCQADAAFFTAGDVGKLLRFNTGEKAIITAYIDDQNVTLDTALGVAVDTAFTMYRVAQVGLATEVKRTNNYLTGAGNCGTTRSGSTFTHQRTFDFTAEVSTQAYSEVGFSNSASAGNNLNTRGLFTGAPISVVAGQQLRVIYYFVVTLAPTSPSDAEWPITGWPAKEYPVAVDTGTDRISLTAHGFTAGTKITLEGTTPPAPLAFGTPYYVVNTAADNFQLEASPGSGAIDITTSGTSVSLFTNTEGVEQLLMNSLSTVDTNGATAAAETVFSSPLLFNDPVSTKYCRVSELSSALPTWPSTQGSCSFATVTNGSKIMSAATYSNGSFTRTWSTTFGTTEANSTLIRRIGFSTSAAATTLFDGLTYLFDYPQEKSNLFTLTIVLRQSWDRDFV
jgi:hypothetical protein